MRLAIEANIRRRDRRRVTVGHMHPSRVQAERLGHLTPDHTVVALGMFTGQPDVLVERERRDAGAVESGVALLDATQTPEPEPRTWTGGGRLVVDLDDGATVADLLEEETTSPPLCET